MNAITQDSTRTPSPTPLAARGLLRLLGRLQSGSLRVQLPGDSVQQFGAGSPHAAIHIGDWDVFAQVACSGDIGLAETFIAGRWTTPDLTRLLAVLAANRAALGDAVHGSWFGRVAYRLRHLLHRNSRAGSRRNIEAHYDLGNAFYSLWLDGTMNYSSALYAHPGEAMEDAQRRKMRRALLQAGAAPGGRLLEIGCGWGALAETAARECGAHVTGVTLSHEQHAHATRRLAGLAADIRLQDYRDIRDEPFDAIVSIEMVEAVGRAYWPGYFQTVARLLKPGGRACIQSIVMADRLWDDYARGTDFIQQYVFPGGFLPCPREFVRHAEAAGLEVTDAFAFGRDYAHTLHGWRERFLARRAELPALGFDERFMRLWEFYLCYCEAAFSQGDTDVVQYTLVRR